MTCSITQLKGLYPEGNWKDETYRSTPCYAHVEHLSYGNMIRVACYPLKLDGNPNRIYYIYDGKLGCWVSEEQFHLFCKKHFKLKNFR